jgi:nanoRNase/pAp phosphatase (c-di-AMP/oligoRNAs hydrolase)
MRAQARSDASGFAVSIPSKEQGMADMKAAVTYKPGGPEVLQIERRPIPTPTLGQVLFRVVGGGRALAGCV